MTFKIRRYTPPALLCAAFLPLCLALGSCVTGSGHRDSMADKLEEGRALYFRQKFDMAASVFTDIIRSIDSPEQPESTARAYRFRGECRQKAQQYGEACGDFEAAVKLAKGCSGEFIDKQAFVFECGMKIGDSYLYRACYRKADQQFNALLKTNPSAEHRDCLLFRRYICAVNLKRNDPEQLLRQIQNRSSFDEIALRKEFLGNSAPTALFKPKHGNGSFESGSFPGMLVYNRSRWNARPTWSNISLMTEITKITVHHTGEVFEGVGFQENANRILAYQTTHQNDNDWADIGYHFLIDRAGRIWEGRPLKYQGAHAGNPQLNRGNIGISVIGNYNEQSVTTAQQRTLTGFIRILCSVYGLSPSKQVVTHREIRPGGTECPGSRLQSFVDRFRRAYR